MLGDNSDNSDYDYKKKDCVSSISNYCHVFFDSCLNYFCNTKHEPEVIINITPRASDFYLAERLSNNIDQTIEIGNMLAEDKGNGEQTPLCSTLSVARL